MKETVVIIIINKQTSDKLMCVVRFYVDEPRLSCVTRYLNTCSASGAQQNQFTSPYPVSLSGWAWQHPQAHGRLREEAESTKSVSGTQQDFLQSQQEGRSQWNAFRVSMRT